MPVLPAVVTIPQLPTATTLLPTALFVAVQTSAGGIVKTIQVPFSQIMTTFSSTTVTVTTSTTLLPTYGKVYFNVPTAATITLPDAATWQAQNTNGSPLLLKDLSGAAATNNITINPAGSNTVDGLTTFQITVNFGWFYLAVTPLNDWTFVG